MEIDKKSMKKMFPHLIKELEGEENKVKIDAVRTDHLKAEEAAVDPDAALVAQAEAALPDKFRHFNPTVVDFIRRCDTIAQAEEIISYMQKRGEITAEYASEVKEKLKKEGVRSFGPKKEEDYYFKHGGLCWRFVGFFL